MARKNNLEVSPAQKAEAGQQVRAREEPPSKTNDTDRAGTEENGKVLRGSKDDDARHKGTIDARSRHDELDSDDAEDLAGLINDASLSGANIPGAKPTDKRSEGRLSRIYNDILNRLIAGSSQKPAESSGGNNNLKSQSSTSQDRGSPTKVPSQEVHDNSAVLNGDKAVPGKNLARPNAIYEDISKMQKPRRSGRPDPYDVPQSPPRSPAPESKPNGPKRRGPKPKRAVTLEKPGQVTMTVEEAPVSAEEELAEPQEHVEHADKGPGRVTRAISAGEERTARPKRATRSTRTNGPEDLEEFRRQHERYQRKTMKEKQESREFLPFSSPTQSWLAVNNGQLEDPGAGNQAAFSAPEPLKTQDELQGIYRTKPQTKGKGPVVGRRDTQLGGNVQVMPTKWQEELEKASVQHKAQPELQGISPILSGPTPAKEIQELPKRLQRPSQRPSLVPKTAQGRKPNASSQQVAKEYPMRSTVSARVSRGTHDDASDEEDNIEHESDASRTPTRATASRSNEDGATDFIDEETLTQLRLTIKKAGQNSEGERVIEDDDYWSAIARTMSRGLTRLISKYKAMNNLISASIVDAGKYDVEHRDALKLINIIREKTQDVLTNRLGDPKLGERNADKLSRSHMLEDLYLYIIPGLVEALYHAVKSRQGRETQKISDLEEFYVLLTILHDLVKACRAEDKSVQPKAPRTNHYRISQPTHSLWPTLRKLHNQCGRQLIARKVARRAEKLRQTMPDRARKRKERLEAEEHAEEEQFQRRLRERNRAIIASLDERRAELGLPPCSQPIEDDMNGRLIGVFGRNNSHPGTTPKEWTKVEMEILVDGLRQERGPTRYEKLATKLERTLDEIFDRAKYLKMQIEYTLKRLQEETPDKEFPAIKPWIENIGSEGFLNQ